MRPLISPCWTALLTVGIVLVVQAKEAFTSGGGEINITHEHVQITFATARKMPMPGDEEAYNKEVVAWEKANQPLATKVIAAIESNVLPTYRDKFTFVAGGFTQSELSRLTSEGTVPTSYRDTGPYLLIVPLDVYPGEYIQSRAMFVVQTRPSKAMVRKFAAEVQTAALATQDRKPPPPRQLTAYWATPPSQGARPSLLLLDVPIATLPEALRQAPWHEIGYENFRRAHALLLDTYRKTFITPNSAEFLLANPTGAKFDAAKNLITLQVNGSYLPPMKIKKATRAQTLLLLSTPLDPTLAPSVRQAARERWQDDIDFLDSLKAELAN